MALAQGFNGVQSKTNQALLAKSIITNINLGSSAQSSTMSTTTTQSVSKRKPKRSKKPESYSFTRNKNESRNSLVKLKGRIRRRIKKTFPRNIGSLFLKDIQPTWTHFLEEYGKGDQNLSSVERPQCFNDYGFMAPPEAWNESKRTVETKAYMDKKSWNDTDYFYKCCHSILEMFGITGISISLLDRTRQIVKFSINHPLTVISRNVSIDGHAILSKESFTILDASRDWRMLYNPMVHGPPFIRFYAAVPLLSKNNIAIGALAVFDPYIRCSCPVGLIDSLLQLASQIIQFIDQPCSALLPRSLVYGPEVSKAVGWSTKVTNWGIPESSVDVIPESNLQLSLTGLRKLNCNPSILHSFEISQELMNSRTAIEAVERAAQILASALGLNVTYIIEMRKSFSYQVPREVLEGYNNGDNFKLEDKYLFGECTKERTKIRLLGGHGLPQKNDMKFDREIHTQVLNSEYGMHFDSPEYYHKS